MLFAGALILAGAAARALPLTAQAAGTVPLLDPAYVHLARLEAFGLVAHGSVAQRPFSRARIGWMAAQAGSALASRSDLAGTVRADLNALLDRLDARFGPETRRRSSLLVEAEAGGGKSPGHGIPDNGLGSVDAVVNPLWSYRGGRAYGDEGTLAAAGRGTLALGPRVAIGLGGRASELRYSGKATRRGPATVEAAYVRALLGRVAIQVGRDAWSFGHGGDTGLLASANQPPLDMIRLSSDRPFRAGLLGDLDFTLLVADLGPAQNFPHAKVFAAKVSVHPASVLEAGLTLSNEQMGEGAPAASFTDRLKDLSFFWDLPHQDQDYQFSDKMASVEGRVRLPSARGLEAYGELAFTDFDIHHLGQIFRGEAAFLGGLRVPRLGRAQRSSLGVEAQFVAPGMYRHHQFTTGTATDGFLRGSALGPDARSLAAQYGYDDPSAGWSGAVTATLERRSVDPWAARRDSVRDLHRLGNLPDERRARIEVGVSRALDGGVGGVELHLGVERVTSFDYVSGNDRTDGAALIRIWHAF